MIDGLRTYSTYRSSEDRWLTQSPSSWEKVRIKYLLREIDRRTQTGEEPLLSMRRDHGLVPLSQFSDKVAEPKALLAYKLVRPGELVVNRMQAGNGLVFVARVPGLISPDYAIFRPIREVNLDYLELLFRSYTLRAKFRSESTGLGTGTAGFLRLYGDSLGAIAIGLPSADEQSKIVRFLRHADHQIQRYIRTKKTLIALLNEQKHAITHRAVTRGVQPSVPLKPSGIDGVGEVPRHWRVRSFTRCAIEKADYRGATPTKTESGVFLVTARNVRKGWIDYEISKEFVAEQDYARIMRRGLPRQGDLLLTMEAPLGNAALVDREDIALAQRVIRFRFDPELLHPEFVLHSVLSPYFQNQLLRRGTGSTAQGIKASKLPQLQLLLPPLPEQAVILKAIGDEWEPFETGRHQAESEVEVLREYRTRLTTDVVTGQIDVREAAALLSDDVDAEPLDEADPVLDGDVDDIAAVPEEAEA